MQDEMHVAVIVDPHHCSAASAGIASVSAANSCIGEAAQFEQRQLKPSTVREGHVSRLVASWQGHEQNLKAGMAGELQKVLKRSNTEPAQAAAANASRLKRLKFLPELTRLGESLLSSNLEASHEMPAARSLQKKYRKRVEQKLGHHLQQQQQRQWPHTVSTVSSQSGAFEVASTDDEHPSAAAKMGVAAGDLLCGADHTASTNCRRASLATKRNAKLRACRAVSMPHRLLDHCQAMAQGEGKLKMFTSRGVADMRQDDKVLPPSTARIVNHLNLASESQVGKMRRERKEEAEQEDCGSTCASSLEIADTNETLQLAVVRGRTTATTRSFNMVVLGVSGGTAGAVTGTAVGAVLGIPSAIMTLGLSVPICSGAGSAAGFFAGSIVGANAGARGASVTVAYERKPAVADAPEGCDNSRLIVCLESQGSDSYSKRRNITLASAVGGSVVMGSLGGASGTAVGGLVGATTGLVAAPFTLGLSIPIGATIGTTMGFLSGTLAGASAGFFGGGMAAKGGFACMDMTT